MAEDRVPLSELLQKAGDGDFLRAVAESVLQILLEADVEGLIGAGRHERSAERLNWRNGYRERTLDTRLGSLNLKIPKLRRKISSLTEIVKKGHDLRNRQHRASCVEGR